MLGDRRPTRDHAAIPKHCGGRFSDFNGRNRVIVCERCNQSKKHYTVWEWLRVCIKGGDSRVRYIQAWINAQRFTEVDALRLIAERATENGAPGSMQTEVNKIYENWAASQVREVQG